MEMFKMRNVENIKQVEYLNDIRDVGMNIIYGTVNGDEVYEIFEKYTEYIFNTEKYLNTLSSIKNLIDARDCTPDKLLMEMGQYTLDIEYEGEEYEEDSYISFY